MQYENLIDYWGMQIQRIVMPNSIEKLTAYRRCPTLYYIEFMTLMGPSDGALELIHMMACVQEDIRSCDLFRKGFFKQIILLIITIAMTMFMVLSL